jgi:hypothetical protein
MRCFVGTSAGRKKKGKKEEQLVHFGFPRPVVPQGRYDSNATPSLSIFGFFSSVEIEQSHER